MTITLDLQQAADLLKLSQGRLRKRASAGIVPGYKPGKAWVFIESELLEYLKSTRPCPCIAAPTLRTGGAASSSTGEKSDFQLAQRIAARRRNLKRSRAPEHTGRSDSGNVLPIRGKQHQPAG